MATFCNYGLQKEEGSITSCPDLHYLYPVPGSVEKADKPEILSKPEWNWRVENWGTKWETYSDEGLKIIRSDISNRLIVVQCAFETAWAPPQGAIQVGSNKFPNLNFTLEYAEPGLMFKGVALYKNGKEYFDHCEENLSEKAMEVDDYTEMEDDWRKAHIRVLKEDINPSTLISWDVKGDMI